MNRHGQDHCGKERGKRNQQRADHQIKVTLHEENQSISATETIRYTNNSPDTLRYIWIQLDQNRFAEGSIGRLTATSSEDILSYGALAASQRHADVEHGFNIESVTDSRGRALNHIIVDTMMRIDLPQALRTGQNTTFSIAWSFNIIEESIIGWKEYEMEVMRDVDDNVVII